MVPLESVPLSAQSQQKAQSSPPSWIDRLFTKEDPFHLHKILGISSLISFFLRFGYYLYDPADDLGFQSHPNAIWVVPTILLHLALSLSSFVFVIPAKRISTGYRIWPEYRLHSLVFLLRSLAIISLICYERVNQRTPNYDWNWFIIMTTLASSELASQSVGEYRSNSIRELRGIPPIVKFAFSWMQFLATAGCLYGARRCTTQMLMVFIVQANALLMTIQRKNIASQTVLVSMYAAFLLFGFVVTNYDYLIYGGGITTLTMGILMANVAALFRLGPRNHRIAAIRMLQDNKFVLWTIMGLLLRAVRPQLEQGTVSLGQILSFTIATSGAVVGLALHQSQPNMQIHQNQVTAVKNRRLRFVLHFQGNLG